MDTDKFKKHITKSIAYAENGGKPNLNKPQKGKTGEMRSVFQFTPNTWKQYSKEVYGKANVPLNNDTESYVVHQKVSKWVDKGLAQGKTPEEITKEIASRWNAGEGRPDAYKTNWKGVNKKYGVSYDTPAYADKVAKYVQEFSQGEQKIAMEPKKNDNLLSKVLGTIKIATPKAPIQETPMDPMDSVLNTIKSSQVDEPMQNTPKNGMLQSLTAPKITLPSE